MNEHFESVLSLLIMLHEIELYESKEVNPCIVDNI